MLATGAKSSLKLGIETAWATPAELKYLLPITSESLNYRIENIRSEALLNRRASLSLAPGQEGVEGSVDCELYPDTTGVLFFLALGKAAAQDPDSTPESGDEYTEITPIGVTEDLPSATVRVNHGGVKAYDYTGLRVRSLSFEGAVGAIPKVTLDFVGKNEGEDLATDSVSVTPTGDPFYFKELTLSKDGTIYDVATYSDIRFTINNNPTEDDYVLDGTGQRIDIAPGDLQITGSATLLFNADVIADEYAKFKNWTSFSLWLKLTKNSTDFIIHFPKLQVTEAPHDIGGRDKITIDLSFEALDDGSNGIIIVEDHFNDTGSY
ncbi:MAG: hypothetical protein DRO36_05035 [Candidatus Hecatellales archaeon]|nr:MAG: hypothetical protein DRO36_05035 [Candidatus Hecatellales archaeon]